MVALIHALYLDTDVYFHFIGDIVHIYIDQSRSCILKDCCRIDDNTVLPPETVVPPFTVFSGSPGAQSGELPSSTQDLMIEATRSYYQHFKPQKKL